MVVPPLSVMNCAILPSINLFTSVSEIIQFQVSF